MKTLFGFFLLLSSTISFGQQSSESVNRKLYISEKKYSLLFPSDWHLKRTDSIQNSFMLLSEKSSPQDNFIENISLHISDLGYSNIKPKFVEEIVNKRVGVSSTIISNRRVKKNDLTGQEIVYKQMLSDGVFATILQYYFVKGRDLYILTFCTKPEEYLNYMPLYQYMYENFDIR